MSSSYKIHNKGQARLFRNPFLESLTKTHPLVIWGVYLPVIGYVPYYGYAQHFFTGWAAMLLFLGGVFFWTFFEYLAHRFLFHWIGRFHRLKRLVYIFHGNHHHYPRDTQRLFMPLVPSVLIASTLFGVFYLLMGGNALGFFPGFLLGYLCYASMHYAIHAWPPPFKWMKPLWRNHSLHHYKNEELGFGVSSTLWDRVFGTMFPRKQHQA